MRPLDLVRTNSAAVFRRFAADTGAATAIEYAMIAAGVSVAIAASVWNLGTTINSTLYHKVDAALH